ncbi:hypothetical protein NQ317_002973 [Molorchus minor]|uniref:Uncharacterized protein n=1 Tax=Molorchus minor TaxID=1323400 RepID=A0ABQ9J716_9CUCU|nr:hypothetical protein NQ317_002973 [Molorchus minor]
MQNIQQVHTETICQCWAGCAGRCSVGFSQKTAIFLTASQDRHIRLYNSGDGSYKLFSSLRAREVGWSIIDVAFSPNKENYVYSTWSSALHLCSVNGSMDHQEPLSLLNTGRRFCVFSVVFSSDGKELLCGANDGSLYIYDLQRHSHSCARVRREQRRLRGRLIAHNLQRRRRRPHQGVGQTDVGESSPKQVGILAGHMDGITFIDSRGDGRHLISNSKDQSIKLWDVRVFFRGAGGGEVAQGRARAGVGLQVARIYNSKSKLEGDTSVMTYRGHMVIKSWLGVDFHKQNNRPEIYLYRVRHWEIYDALTGKIEDNINGHVACVRDVAWHPTRNEILSSSWDGMVGRWTYIDKDSLEETEEWELEKMITYKRSQPLRRSLRLALKKKRSRLRFSRIRNFVLT